MCRHEVNRLLGKPDMMLVSKYGPSDVYRLAGFTVNYDLDGKVAFIYVIETNEQGR
jgi:hypothetical protein